MNEVVPAIDSRGAGVAAGVSVEGLESHLVEAVSALRLVIETIGAVIVGVGVIGMVVRWARGRLGWAPRVTFRGVRLQLSQYLALALEFQLAGDILSTAIAPSWEELGKLAAIAAIRTFLNYFLGLETKELTEGGEVSPAPAEARSEDSEEPLPARRPLPAGS